MRVCRGGSDCEFVKILHIRCIRIACSESAFQDFDTGASREQNCLGRISVEYDNLAASLVASQARIEPKSG